MIKTLNFQRANFHFFKGVVDRMPWKQPSGIMELNRAGTHLKTFFLEYKYSQNLLIAALRPGKQKLSHDHSTAILH